MRHWQQRIQWRRRVRDIALTYVDSSNHVVVQKVATSMHSFIMISVKIAANVRCHSCIFLSSGSTSTPVHETDSIYRSVADPVPCVSSPYAVKFIQFSNSIFKSSEIVFITWLRAPILGGGVLGGTIFRL